MVRTFTSARTATRGVRAVAIAGAVGLAALTAGCSSGDDDSTAPSSSATSAGPASTASSTSDPSSPSTSDSGGGSASGDLVSWAGDFCGAVRPMVEQLQGFTAAPSDASDPAALVAQYQALMAAVGPAMADASDAIDGLDAPPIDDGENIKSQMVTLLDESAAAFDKIATQIAALDPNDPNAFASFGSAMSAIEPDLDKSSEALDKAFDDANMQDAFDQAPECAGLDMGS